MISHAHEISSLFSISNEVLITYSNGDSVMKVWRLDENGCKNLYTVKHSSKLLAIRYDQQAKCIAVMDKDCRLGVCRKDLLVEDPEKAPASEEEDDIDLENIEMDDLVEDDQKQPEPEVEKTAEPVAEVTEQVKQASAQPRQPAAAVEPVAQEAVKKPAVMSQVSQHQPKTRNTVDNE